MPLESLLLGAGCSLAVGAIANQTFQGWRMAFLRRETAETMLSKAISSSEIGRGLDHILDDLKENLPDDLEKLEEITVKQHLWLVTNSFITASAKYRADMIVYLHNLFSPPLGMMLFFTGQLPTQELEKELADLEAAASSVRGPSF